MSVKVYLATSMTGRNQREMVEEALVAIAGLKKYGLIGISPVIAEGVQSLDKLLLPFSEEELWVQWKNDKKLIRQCHVILDLSGFSVSEGVKHEIGYARYALFKPVVRIHPNLGISVARFEDDGIVSSVEEAAQLIHTFWGSWVKRMCWRTHIFLKWPKLLLFQAISLLK